MHLIETEKGMLAGKNGKACELAMNILVDLGELYGAKRMISISQVATLRLMRRRLRSAVIVLSQPWADYLRPAPLRLI